MKKSSNTRTKNYCIIKKKNENKNVEITIKKNIYARVEFARLCIIA